MTVHTAFESVRTANPRTWPQHPFDSPPEVPESSAPTYAIHAEDDILIPMRDGVRLAADVFRPSAPGRRFPALLATSPYSRQLQRTDLPLGQNEAGLTEFWVPRGYAQIVVDVRGSNDSEGSWDMMGPREQQDLYDLIEWAAQQPWCDGNVGMTGESYFGWSQLMAATQQPPHLRAIFALNAAIDCYRERYFNGGILRRSAVNFWFDCLRTLNMHGGRLKDPSGMLRHFKTITTMEYPFDGPYYQERLSWPRLDRIQVPVCFGSSWEQRQLHLRGACEGWASVRNVPKRLFIGPYPKPPKPMGAYHHEALRWYDHYLKGMDTRVMEGPPIQLFVQGLNRWRGEAEWPLARTHWQELFLADGALGQGKLADSPGGDGEATYSYEPSSYEAYLGGPKLVYRTGPLPRDTEVTGPLALYLWASSTATDTDWLAVVSDESPDGLVRELTQGWLRASHRELDTVRSTPWRPFHPHLRADLLNTSQAYEFAIELWPTSNLFRAGHRIRLEIASCDDQSNIFSYHQPLMLAARNTVLEGNSHPSRLLVPVVPPR